MFGEGFRSSVGMPHNRLRNLLDRQTSYLRTGELLLPHPQVPVKFAALKQSCRKHRIYRASAVGKYAKAFHKPQPRRNQPLDKSNFRRILFQGRRARDPLPVERREHQLIIGFAACDSAGPVLRFDDENAKRSNDQMIYLGCRKDTAGRVNKNKAIE